MKLVNYKDLKIGDKFKLVTDIYVYTAENSPVFEIRKSRIGKDAYNVKTGRGIFFADLYYQNRQVELVD